MGGGFVARALADAGHDVSLIERGNEKLSESSGNMPSEDPEKRLTESRWPNSSTFEIDGVTSRFYAPLGSGLGGAPIGMLRLWNDSETSTWIRDLNRCIRLADGQSAIPNFSLTTSRPSGCSMWSVQTIH